MASYGIIFPVYNEESRIENGIKIAYKYISSLDINFQFLIVDNGSMDRTEELGRELCGKYKNVNYLRTKEKGVGVAFRNGVDALNTDVVGYMDIDLSTDIRYFSKVVKIFETNDKVVLVNGSRFSRKSKTTGRKWYRNLTSYGLIFILKIIFGMKASDAICGFKFFARSYVEELIQCSSDENGWFYIIELLLRTENEGEKIVELPVKWQDDANNSKVDMIKVIKSYLKGIRDLRKELKR